MKKTNQSIIDAYACLEAGGRVWHNGLSATLNGDQMLWSGPGCSVIVVKNNLTGWTCEWPEEDLYTKDSKGEFVPVARCEMCGDRKATICDENQDEICDRCNDMKQPEQEPTVDPGEEYALNAFEWLEEIAEKHGIESYSLPEEMEMEIQKLLTMCCQYRRKIAGEPAPVNQLLADEAPQPCDDIDGNSKSWKGK